MTHLLDSRQAVILTALLETSKSQSVNRLAERVNLSERVVRYNLPMIEAWLSLRNIDLITRQRIGVHVQADAETRRALLKELQEAQFNLLLTPKDRLQLILFDLLTDPGQRTGADWEQQLGISHATLARDMEGVEKWLEPFHLYLKRKQRTGTALVGREIDIRHATVALCLQVVPEVHLLHATAWGLRRHTPDLEDSGANNLLFPLICEWPLPEAWRVISLIEEALDTSLTDSAHLYLSLYQAIMTRRVQAGHFVQLSHDQLAPLLAQPEYPLVEAVLEQRYRQTGQRWSQAEIGQLTLEIVTSARQSGSEPPLPSRADVDLPEFTAHLVARIEQQVDVRLAHPEVLSRLQEHLARSITRLRYGLPITNPLTAEVRQTYPDLWQATAVTLADLAPDLGVKFPEEEIGFVTMYMGLALDMTRQTEKPRPRVVVACPSGGVTVWMLVSRLRSALPGIEIVEVVPIRHLNRISARHADAIITTAAIQSATLPVIKVSPFINEQEVNQIRTALGIDTDQRPPAKPR
jgi:transcriptional antiterminator